MEAYLVFFSTAYVSKMEGSLEQSCSLQVMDNEAFFSFLLLEKEAPIWTWSVVLEENENLRLTYGCIFLL